MSEFRMPSLGADMEAGTLVEWLRKPGEPVKPGDIVAVVETQKGAIEIEIFQDGILDRLLVEPGTKVPVGTPLALVRTAGEQPAPAPQTTPAPTPRPAPAPAVAGGRVLASPAARRLAAERGVDLATLTGSGPGGAVLSTDIAPPEPRRTGRLDLAAMRKAIAAAMSRSKREIPHYYLSASIDLTAATEWLARVNADRAAAERLVMGLVLARAVALALPKHPVLNGFYRDGFEASERVHIGMAISLRGGGLVAPALHDADRRPLDDLMAGFRDLVARARAGTFRSSEFSDPTITVSSFGERGVDGLMPVIYPQQVAIVGFGTPAPRPWAVEGRVEVRQVLVASVAGDHRVSDGHRGALFLRDVADLLQHPEDL